MNKAFFDTNVLVYASDPGNPARQAVARDLLRRHAQDANGVLSTQVLQEFYFVSTRKIRLAPQAARAIVSAFRRVFEIVTIDPDLIEAAIETSILDRVSLRDALILRAAAAAQCGAVYSEDLNHGQEIAGVLVQSPFL